MSSQSRQAKQAGVNRYFLDLMNEYLDSEKNVLPWASTHIKDSQSGYDRYLQLSAEWTDQSALRHEVGSEAWTHIDTVGVGSATRETTISCKAFTKTLKILYVSAQLILLDSDNTGNDLFCLRLIPPHIVIQQLARQVNKFNACNV